MNIIKLRHLSKSFQEGGQTRTVLSDLSLTISEGEFVILLGKSGSGKSTLLNLISGIESPTVGEVWVNGMNITRLRDQERTLFRRDHIGFIFQFFNLIPTLNVLENVTLPLELAAVSDRRAREAAARLLTEVGLDDRLNSFPDKLSGGEQQRVAIARALAADPLLVLADEPTGNLDEETGRQIIDLLLRMTQAAGKTLLMATHNPELVALADRVLRVHDGAVVETYSTSSNLGVDGLGLGGTWPGAIGATHMEEVSAITPAELPSDVD
jgi:putative ABC transport system ATP-binding protein